jgi:hypothetical protein
MHYLLIYDSYGIIFLIILTKKQEFILLFYSANIAIFSNAIINVLLHYKVIQFSNAILLLRQKLIFSFAYYFE